MKIFYSILGFVLIIIGVITGLYLIRSMNGGAGTPDTFFWIFIGVALPVLFGLTFITIRQEQINRTTNASAWILCAAFVALLVSFYIMSTTSDAGLLVVPVFSLLVGSLVIISFALLLIGRFKK